jgi:hypothetical protein
MLQQVSTGFIVKCNFAWCQYWTSKVDVVPLHESSFLSCYHRSPGRTVDISSCLLKFPVLPRHVAVERVAILQNLVTDSAGVAVWTIAVRNKPHVFCLEFSLFKGPWHQNVNPYSFFFHESTPHGPRRRSLLFFEFCLNSRRYSKKNFSYLHQRSFSSISIYFKETIATAWIGENL